MNQVCWLYITPLVFVTLLIDELYRYRKMLFQNSLYIYFWGLYWGYQYLFGENVLLLIGVGTRHVALEKHTASMKKIASPPRSSSWSSPAWGRRNTRKVRWRAKSFRSLFSFLAFFSLGPLWSASLLWSALILSSAPACETILSYNNTDIKVSLPVVALQQLSK